MTPGPGFRDLSAKSKFLAATWKSLGYIGNMAMGGAYPGVPDEIIKRLGLEGL